MILYFISKKYIYELYNSNNDISEEKGHQEGICDFTVLQKELRPGIWTTNCCTAHFLMPQQGYNLDEIICTTVLSVITLTKVLFERSLCMLSAVLALLDEILVPGADIHHDPVLVGSHLPEHLWLRLHGPRRDERLGGLRATAAAGKSARGRMVVATGTG